MMPSVVAVCQTSLSSLASSPSYSHLPPKSISEGFFGCFVDSEDIIEQPDIMSTRVRLAIENSINTTSRRMWKSNDGNGPEGPDHFAEYLFFNPSMREITSMNTITQSQVDNNKVSHLLPKRVKLSDSAIGLVVTIRISVTKRTAWFPLDFNSAGFVIAQPVHSHF